jgi:hypothetical protein
MPMGDGTGPGGSGSGRGRGRGRDKAGAGAEWVASARGRAAIVFAPSAENSRSIWLRNRALRENARVAEHP